ncbi:hypothetical protein SEVIR_4G113000v4 [Setaria viridis]|uniref:Uncharacterized protein n=1 Tax=Setaria viridis TaxID=4556 RepID=A0A4U6UYW1_SETVI|nr:uncharacterized protein LOC117853911 [Setaria viridis]TKW20805.1 hypothetical protein SEVIR_4G113000v2 [Setaria viridis]
MEQYLVTIDSCRPPSSDSRPPYMWPPSADSIWWTWPKRFTFPSSGSLDFEFLKISDCTMNSIIAGCPVLECLLINACTGFSPIRINSPSPRSIAMSCMELIIEDAPSLQRLVHLKPCSALRVSVISAPKLETLGCLCDHGFESNLVFGTTVIQNLHSDCFTTVASSVKILAICIFNLSLDMVIDLMRCFPCLEKLYIQSCLAKDKNLWRGKHRNLRRCLDIRLKTIVLKNYQGMMSQVNFATFFVLNAKMLEFMRFEVGADNDNEVFIAEQHRKLQLEKKASRYAQFYFTNSGGCHGLGLSHVKPVTDLSITDPFECRC